MSDKVKNIINKVVEEHTNEQIRLNEMVRTAANKRIADFLESTQKFIGKIDELLVETKTDEFADHGDPIYALEDIESLVISFKGYLKEFEKNS